MRIEVTQEHIDEATRRRGADGTALCYDCPIALALADKYGHVMVSSHEYFTGSEIGTSLPEAAKQFIEAFDNWRPVSPITLEL